MRVPLQDGATRVVGTQMLAPPPATKVEALAVRALDLLQRGVASPPRAVVPAAAGDAGLANAELLHALGEFARHADASIDAIRSALSGSQVLVALRTPNLRRPSGTDGRNSVVLVTTRSGKRLLPLFSSSTALDAFSAARGHTGSPIPAARLFEVAVHVGFEALEFDRGSAHAWRLSRQQIEALHRALGSFDPDQTQPLTLLLEGDSVAG